MRRLDRCRFVVLVCSFVWTMARTAPASAQAQAGDPAQPPPESAGSVVPDTGPKVTVRGFADINFSDTSNGRTDDGKAYDGFRLGNFVGHVSANLEHNVSFYTEIVVAPKPDAYGFEIDVSRAIIRYDFGDHFKISGGRYDAPVSYWNAAFHRGAWLQTTIFRPDIVKEQFYQPDHFEGIVAEGLAWRTPGLHYSVGWGNGREGDLLLDGTAGGSSRHRAAVAKVFLRPPQVTGVEFGGAVYHDTIAATQYIGDGSQVTAFPELITSGYIAITREAPELIAEYSRVRHHDPTFGRDYDSHAFYVQAAWRFPQAPKVKPYTRYEKATDPQDEPVFGNLSNSKMMGGLRYDVTDYAAVKVEGSQRRRPGQANVNGFFVQAAVTF